MSSIKPTAIGRRIIFLLLLLTTPLSQCCTNVLVTPGASKDGSSMIAYDADSAALMGTLYHYPATNTTDGGDVPMRKVYDWDSGRYLGEIPESPVTYNVVGNTNEHGLVIAETTFGGLETLSNQTGAIIDYGSLIYITLQRATTAREAIATMSHLMDTYGYASEGESFSLTDRSGEVWIMEVIGRGDIIPDRLGAVWVARRVPDGYVASHANQARITTFPRDDPDNCLYADDVVDLAVTMGLYERKADGSDDDFSFSDIYDPVTFEGARWCEARVWSVFSPIAEEREFKNRYEDYARGADLTNRMPLWIKPARPLSIHDVASLMANHYDNSALSCDADPGAGIYNDPNRPHPLLWDYKGTEYVNERPVGTQQTGWNFIAQVRPWMPAATASILWFGADDSSTAPRYPVYGSSVAVSEAFKGLGSQDGVKQPLLSFDLTKAFWVQNMVSNLAYSRWDEIYPVVWRKMEEVMDEFVQNVAEVDQMMTSLLLNEEGDERDDDAITLAVEHMTNFSVAAGDALHSKWLQFYGELFVRFRDGYNIVPDDEEASCGCTVLQTGFTDDWKKRIVDETGDKYKVIGGPNGHGGRGNDHSDPVNAAANVKLRASVATATISVETKDVLHKPMNKIKLKALQ